jgi:hypothetical protein
MRSFEVARLLGLAIWLGAAACGSVSGQVDGSGSGGQAGAGTDAGGGASGTAAASGTSGAAGAAGASGTITFELVLPAGKPFCDQWSMCALAAPSHLEILTAAGQALTLAAPLCADRCGSPCQITACPPLACVAAFGTVLTGAEAPWDGTTYTDGTCPSTGNSCTARTHAPAGSYVARMCATPGTLNPPDGGLAQCAATGPVECVDVPFTYPGPSPVVAHLP